MFFAVKKTILAILKSCMPPPPRPTNKWEGGGGVTILKMDHECFMILFFSVATLHFLDVHVPHLYWYKDGL